MMNYFSKRKKFMAYLILLTFMFTCIVPTNIVGGNSEAWAGTVTATPAQGVTVKVFNYNSTVNGKGLGSSGYTFFHGDYVEASGTGDYYELEGAVDGKGTTATYNKPVLQKTLYVDGAGNKYPYVSDTDKNVSGSLGYLFGADSTYQKGTLPNGGGLFQKDANGYYYYDSAKNAASLMNVNQLRDSFVLYDYVVRPSYTAADGTDVQRGNLLPFNDVSSLNTDVTLTNGVAGAKIPVGTLTDLWFGMTLDFDFFMPKGGLMNEKAMVFDFHGDDDVWVYIDDVLVLDIGGTHGAQSGNINFATGIATDPNANSDGRTLYDIFVDAKGVANVDETKFVDVNNDGRLDTFADYTPHALKFFYMERGGNISYCKIQFNMPTLPEGSLTVGKEVTEPDNELTKALLTDKDYTFRVLESDAEGKLKTKGTEYVAFIPENTEYSILENGVDNGKKGKVDANGQFTLKANETAVFPGLFKNNTNEHYAVAEIVDNTQYNVTCSVNGTPVTSSTSDSIVLTGALATENSQIVAFTNKPILCPLEITKQITDGDENEFLAEQEYQMLVRADGDLLPVGTKYTVGSTEKTIETAGIVTIKANETAVISGFLAGTKYEVEELGLNSLGADAAYQDALGTITKDPTASVTVTNSSTQEYISVSGQKTWVDNDDELKKRPGEIKLYLFRDGAEMQGVTTTTSLDMGWKYSFDNLPRYATNATVTGEEKADGHEYEYLVAEQKLDNYAPTYKVPVRDADGDVRIDLTNTYGEPETETSIKVTKVWNDDNDKLGKRPDAITLKLFNGVDTEPVCTTTASYDYTFTNLPLYNGDVPYVYTVTEEPVDHYLSAVVPTEDGFEITNTLYTGQAGQFTVNKQVSGELTPPENSEFKFNLQIKAEVVDWDAVLVSKKMELEEAHEEAYKALNGSADDGINGAIKDAEDATEEFINNAKLTTPSAYQYVLVDGGNALFAVDRTSPSAYIWESASAVTIDENADKGIVAEVAEAIKELAQKFSNLLDKPAVFIELLHEKVAITTSSAVVFDKADAEKLFNAEKARVAAVELEASTKAAYDNFETEVATPSAITIKMKADSNKLSDQTIKLDPDKDARDAEGFYNVPFTLFKGTGYTFTVEATTGANIDYKISETEWPTENYEKTDINVNGDTTLSSTRFTGQYGMNAKQANTFIFHNVYKTPEDTPYIPPVIPDPEPEPTKPEPDPEEIIPDDNVPTGSVEVPGEPLDELNDPEIPLGDAPATGDNNNAVPFVVLMMLAAAGLVITRRKFN